MVSKHIGSHSLGGETSQPLGSCYVGDDGGLTGSYFLFKGVTRQNDITEQEGGGRGNVKQPLLFEGEMYKKCDHPVIIIHHISPLLKREVNTTQQSH